MNIRKFLRDNIFFPLIDLLPGTLKNKLKMAGTCCFGSGWRYLYFANFAKEFETLSEKDICDLYSELSTHSLMVLQRYLRYCHFINTCCKYVNTAYHDCFIVPLENMFPGVEAKVAFEEKNGCNTVQVYRYCVFFSVLPYCLITFYSVMAGVLLSGIYFGCNHFCDYRRLAAQAY